MTIAVNTSRPGTEHPTIAYKLMAWTAAFGTLKRIPFAPYVFDILLTAFTMLAQPRLIGRILQVEHAAAAWDGVTIHAHRFGGIEFRVGTREIGHIHGNGIVDVPLPRLVAERLFAGRRVLRHHTKPDSGWVTIAIDEDVDAQVAIGVLRPAYERCPCDAGSI